MFLAILNWLLARTPGFMRPAVSWLLDGLRKITSHIAGRWNAVGVAAGLLYGGITGLRTLLSGYAVSVLHTLTWIVAVYVPRKVSDGLHGLERLVVNSIAAIRREVGDWLDALDRWIDWALAEVRQFATGVRNWAVAQVNDILDTLRALRNALAPILAGPGALAEWLIEHLWRASLRYAMAQRDRIALWVLTGSVSATRWLANTIGDIIGRIL